MADRLFVPASFSWLLATMPSADAIREDREHWLDVAYHTMRGEFTGPHGLSAMRLARVFRAALAAAYEEAETGSSALAA
ncbi:hypothetical protein [Amycolatopsis rifamycinica]|uniref:Uncharacterized protein n=1 Tax=Amycolatopsis rifamycinica TaxID=287986 RepID=A0A066U834_9PSEU|nr:hypothetical protein [Amycolatopsis rifamycinica]KDN23225.1 hypothetical protein DV20_05775 [Amycolatopsis rifamycinica]